LSVCDPRSLAPKQLPGYSLKKSPRILLVDIETAPIEALVWTMFEANVIHVLQPTYMLSFSVKWLDKKPVKTHALCDYPSYDENKTDDGKLVADLWKYFDQADIIVGHNSDSFDIKKTNARFAVNGLGPPSPYQTVDTLKQCRRYFKFDSNKLDNVARYLGIGRKLPHTGKDLWLGCMRGDPKSWGVMKRYNAQDVRLTEAVFLKLRHWDKSHPNLAVYMGQKCCPVCTSAKVQLRGVNVARTRKTQRMHCQDCGHWFSGDPIKAEKK
jgi:hypothetical protein